MSQSLLKVEGLETSFITPNGRALAVAGLSFSLDRGQCLGIVGESGCGKSVTAMSILGLAQGAKIEAGTAYLDGSDLLKATPAELRQIRGRRVGMIFQEPMTSLNPLYPVGSQIGEVLRIHLNLPRAQRRLRVLDLMRLVRIPAPEARYGSYPHELSGGMRQRVMIAIALAMDPELLIADEPTTALDVTVQAQILGLLASLRHGRQLGIVLITHDLGVVAESCDTLLVMYAGKAVESGSVATILAAPAHPYTRGLMASRPRLGSGQKRLTTIEGSVPALGQFPQGCRFQERCPHVTAQCRSEEPMLRSLATGVQVACFHPQQ